MLSNKICVGLISKPIGIKGQVKVVSYTESPASLFEYKNLFLENNTKIHFINVKLIDKNVFTAFIDGVNNRKDSEKYSSKKIYINREELPQLSNNEYYYNDLINSKVFDTSNNLLGTVKSVLNYGAGDFLEIILINNKEIHFNDKLAMNNNLNNEFIENKDIPVSYNDKSTIDKETPILYDDKTIISNKIPVFHNNESKKLSNNKSTVNKEATIPFNNNSIISIDTEQKSIVINKDYLLI